MDPAFRGARARAVIGARPVRFVLAGTVNTVFGLAIYPALLWSVPALRVHYLVALAVAQVVSTAFAYLTYKLMVFRTRSGVGREIGLFGTFYLVAAALNWVALPFLVEVARLPPIVAQVGFSAVLMGASYLWHSRLTFRRAGASDVE